MKREQKVQQLWTVESGSYSDWRIHAVFESEADAEAWAANLRGLPNAWHSDASVGRIALVPRGVAPYSVTTYYLLATLWDDGRIEDEHCHIRGRVCD